jgi:hypothetical protein
MDDRGNDFAFSFAVKLRLGRTERFRQGEKRDILILELA